MSDDLHPTSGAFVGPEHRFPVRVYAEDTDFGGIAYHAAYVRFMERGRTEMLRARGAHQSELIADGAGIAFVVRRMTLDFAGAARMDDALTVATRLAALRGATLTLHQEVRRGDAVLVSAEVTVACVRQGRAARIPDALRRVLAPDQTLG
ncbi:MAG TPA: tol-pal system-associated acyl-CoA thioesterase [Beijerinckiaceae bacterium]